MTKNMQLRLQLGVLDWKIRLAKWIVTSTSVTIGSVVNSRFVGISIGSERLGIKIS